MAPYTDPHCCAGWGRGRWGEEIRGGGDSSNVKGKTSWQSGEHTHINTHTFTFATLPQFWYGATPPPVRKESSRFTVYITYTDQ